MEHLGLNLLRVGFKRRGRRFRSKPKEDHAEKTTARPPSNTPFTVCAPTSTTIKAAGTELLPGCLKAVWLEFLRLEKSAPQTDSKACVKTQISARLPSGPHKTLRHFGLGCSGRHARNNQVSTGSRPRSTNAWEPESSLTGIFEA